MPDQINDMEEYRKIKGGLKLLGGTAGSIGGASAVNLPAMRELGELMVKGEKPMAHKTLRRFAAKEISKPIMGGVAGVLAALIAARMFKPQEIEKAAGTKEVAKDVGAGVAGGVIMGATLFPLLEKIFKQKPVGMKRNIMAGALLGLGEGLLNVGYEKILSGRGSKFRKHAENAHEPEKNKKLRETSADYPFYPFSKGAKDVMSVGRGKTISRVIKVIGEG